MYVPNALVSELKMIFWCNVLLIIATFHANAEILIDSDGGYKNIIVGISPNLPPLEIENQLSHLKTLFRSTSEALFTASKKNVFFKDITFALPKMYKGWISRINLVDANSSASFRKPDMFLTENDVFEKPYTIQHSGCGKPGLRVNIPSEFLKARLDNKASSLVRQWAHYRYGVFDENGFSGDKIYPACYRIPGSDNIKISDCTNEKAIYEFENSRNYYEQFPNVCTPVPISGKNDHIVSSLMTNIDFPKVSYFCDDDTRPHNRNAPTKQNALCREKSTWEVISGHKDFQIKNKRTSNVKPGFKYVFESDPYFVIAVDTSKEMKPNDRMSLILNAFSYFLFYDLPNNSTVRLIDMKNKDDGIIERRILKESDAKWLIDNFPEIDQERDSCVHCTIQKLLEDLKLDISDIVVITATDIMSSWVDNITTMLKSNKVALHVIYFEEKLTHATFLEKISKNSGGNFFYIPEAFPTGSSVSSLLILYEAFRSIYESFSWLNKKNVLVDQMTFSNNCSPKCILSFPSDHSMSTLQVIITGTEFANIPNSPILRKSIVLDNGIQRFISGNDSFIFRSEIPAYIITVHNPKAGKWDLAFERKPEFNKPVVAIVRATSKDFGDIIHMQSWISTEDNANVGSSFIPPITIYSEIKKNNNPVIDIEVIATIHQASYNMERSLKLQDSGDGDPDITRNDGIFSKYLTDIVESGYYSITITAEKKSALTHYNSANEKHKETNCCGSFIPEYLSYDSGSFKRVKTFQSFFVNEEKIGKTYPPRRVVDLRVDRLEILTNGKRCYVLYWTAPGENYDKGKALSYDFKVFKTREDALNNFSSNYVLEIKMLNVQGPLLEPHEVGTIESAFIELTNLTSGTYFMALTTISHSGKISDVSNVVQLSYTEEYPLYTGTGYSNGEFYTFPLDGTTETSENDSKIAMSSNFGLAIGLTCGFLFLMIILGFILFIYFERRKNAKDNPNPTLGQNAKMTESNDVLCRPNEDGNISIISPVNSWGASSLISRYETLQQQKTTEINGTMNIPANTETDSVSLTSSKYSYDNKFEQNSSIYDPIYYHQVRNQDELNYPYSPTYTPFDPTYTSSLRRLDDNNDIVLNPYAADNISYCSYSLNRNQASRLKTDV